MTDKKLKMIGYSGRKKKAPVSGKKQKQAYAAIILGFLLMPGGILMSGLIQSLIDSEVADFIKTPIPSDAGYSDFLTDEREGAIPMYTNFYMHNLTNADDVLNGSKPIFEEIGPYVYRVYSYKYDISYNDDYSEITYKGYSKYVFQPELSGDGLSTDDLIMNINPGYQGVLGLMGNEEELVKAMAPSVLAQVKQEFADMFNEMLGVAGILVPDPELVLLWDWAEDHFPPWGIGIDLGLMRWAGKGILDDMGVDIDGLMYGIDMANDPDGTYGGLANVSDGFMGRPDDLSMVHRPPPLLGLPFLGNDPILGIPIETAKALWNPDHPSGKSLTGFDPLGAAEWYEANFDPIIFNDLRDTFGLTDNQTSTIKNWLWDAIQPSGFITNLCQFQIESWESDIITFRSVDEWLLTGVDELIYMVEPGMAKVGIFSSFESEWDSEVAGASPSTFNTGQTNINDIGQYVKYNDGAVITQWNQNVNLSGTGGSQFAPGVTKNQDLEIFIPQFLRPLSVEYSKDVSLKGVDLLRYVLPADAFPIDTTTFNDNIEGLANMGVVYGAPVYLGQPHFYGVDPTLLDAVDIAPPDQELHELYIDVEPNTGATMGARLRMGIYIYVTPTDRWYTEITEAMYPIFWLEQAADIPDDLASMFKNLVYMALDLKNYIHSGFVGGGAALLCVGIVVTTTQRRKTNQKRLEKFETQKKEFHKYKHELQKYKESKMVLPPSVPKKKNLDQTK